MTDIQIKKTSEEPGAAMIAVTVPSAIPLGNEVVLTVAPKAK